ncbi:hypothetical protein pdam_00002120, partial [Pocillopora damicornis]
KENVNLFDVLMCVSPFISLAVRLWSLHSYTNVVAYKGHNFPVWDLDISPQCLYFATGSQDRTARLWNLEYTFPLRIFAGHLQDVDVRFVSNFIKTVRISLPPHRTALVAYGTYSLETVSDFSQDTRVQFML